jgi:Domain of unknown function (DUF4390)
MDFFTHCFKNKLVELGGRWFLGALMWLLLGGAQVHAQVLADVSQIKVERVDEAVQLSAQVQFEIPSAVEDALLKGIPMVFMAEADILRERWYWYDKKVITAQRSMRLSYQPLTRRWRLNINSGVGAPVGLALNQSLDSLAQALAVIKRVTLWKIADVAELDASARYRVEFRFRLDLSQLPRPFQIGAIGQSDWDINGSVVVPLSLETSR